MICVWEFVCVFVCIPVCHIVCMCTRMHVYGFVVYVCVCVCVCMCVCMCVCVCIYIYKSAFMLVQVVSFAIASHFPVMLPVATRPQFSVLATGPLTTLHSTSMCTMSVGTQNWSRSMDRSIPTSWPQEQRSSVEMSPTCVPYMRSIMFSLPLHIFFVGDRPGIFWILDAFQQ